MNGTGVTIASEDRALAMAPPCTAASCLPTVTATVTSVKLSLDVSSSRH